MNDKVVVRVPMETKPDIQDVYGLTYTKKALDNAIAHQKRRINFLPIILEEKYGECIDKEKWFIDVDKATPLALGYVKEIYDDYIVTNIFKEKEKEVRKYIDDNYKAYIVYLTDNPSLEITDNIRRILYFGLRKI